MTQRSERAPWATDEKRDHWYHVLDGDPKTIDALFRDTCRTYHDLMDRVMLVNGHVYGDIAEAYPHKVDAIASLEKRLAKYKEDGNVRWLVDIGNFAMLEFTHPRHAAAHLGEDGTVGRVTEASQHDRTHNTELG